MCEGGIDNVCIKIIVHTCAIQIRTYMFCVSRGRGGEGEKKRETCNETIYMCPSVLMNTNSNQFFHLYPCHLMLSQIKELNLVTVVILLSTFPTHLEKQMHSHNATNQMIEP